MTTLAEQIAEVKVGDWAIAEFYDAENGNKWGVEGNIYSGAGGSLIIRNDVIRFNTGNIDPNLTSITRVPRPIPSEPEVESFGLTDENEIVRRESESTFASHSWVALVYSGTGKQFTWEGIYPHITRLYTPSGELVTGFDYAGKETL